MKAQPATLGDILLSISDASDRIALIIGGKELTYGAFKARAACVGERLAAILPERGCRVGLISTDRFESFELLFGAAYSGAVLTPLNLKLALPELEYMVKDSQMRILFVERAFYGVAEQLESSRPDPPAIVALDGGHPRWPDYQRWLKSSPPPSGPRPATRDDVVAQLYTSGTTGRPKGVQLPHRSFLAIHDSMRNAGESWFLWKADDVGLLNLPFYHVGSPWWVASSFAAGATLVVLPKFDASEVLKAIVRHKVTRLGFVPAMLQMVLADPMAKETDFSTVRQCFYGGSPIAASLLKRAQRTMRCDFGQFYGMTETGNAVVCLRPEDHRASDPGLLRAAGRAFAGVEVKCIDARGQRVAAGSAGEICLKSESNMVGYWNLPAETAETLRDGWIHTGDAGHIDERGYVYITDRIKDLVISAGENISPAEVEEALLKHPDVAEAAAIGVPHERWGEVVKAMVVLQPGKSPSTADILEIARQHVAEYKVPRSVEFVTSLPRNAMGKVKRAELRAPFWAGRERRVN